MWTHGTVEIGRPFGIPMRLHWLWLVLAGALALGPLMAGSPLGALLAVVQLTAVFALVALHELGHCLAARSFGVSVSRITLWPLGGVAEMGAVGHRPRVEFWVAAAGPLVNFVLAALLSPLALMVYWAGGGLGPVAWLVGVNLVLGLFNLLPAFPLDGGRLLRAALAGWRGSTLWATETAVRISWIVAALLALTGVVVDPWLIVLAVFVVLLGQAELTQVRQQAALESVIHTRFAQPRDVGALMDQLFGRDRLRPGGGPGW